MQIRKPAPVIPMASVGLSITRNVRSAKLTHLLRVGKATYRACETHIVHTTAFMKELVSNRKVMAWEETFISGTFTREGLS